MEIKIKHNGSELYVKGLEGNAETVKDLYKMVTENYIVSAVTPLSVEPLRPSYGLHPDNTVKSESQEQDKDMFNIRERIPNSVDIKDLDIKKAVTEHALVRCPNCGQSHAILVQNDANKYCLMKKDYDKNEFQIIQDNIDEEQLGQVICKGRSQEREYFEDLQKIPAKDEDLDFVVNNETSIRCPVCRHKSSFLYWKEAWETPLKYFETENICDICGGEVSTSITKNGCNDGICNVCHTEVKNGKPVSK